MRMLPLYAALALLQGSTSYAREPIPLSGLRLHFDAAVGVQTTGDQVTVWQNQVENAFHAEAIEAYDRPTLTRDCEGLQGQAVSFRGRQLLKITGAMLPEQTRAMSILAVARTRGPVGVGIFSIRQAAVPLIQLDTDSHGSARFIVRDARHTTLQSLGDYAVGRWAVYAGVLQEDDEGGGQITVFLGDHLGSKGVGRFESPVVGQAAWIGALPLDNRLLSWNGDIAEVMVFDRALGTSEREAIAKSLCEKHGIPFQWTGVASDEQIYPWTSQPKPADDTISTDVCVVGAGSAGIAAALAAARRGASVVLIERQARLGGTGVNAFVSAWEPGPGCRIAREIYDRLSQLPNATGVAKRYANATNSFSLGQWYVTPQLAYEASLQRCGVPRDEMRCIPYDPQAMDQVARALLNETGRVSLMDRTTFFFAETDDSNTRVESILVETDCGRVIRIRAKIFIDSTGCIHLARAVGCEAMLGVDPQARFHEPSAPARGRLQLNAISRCYRIRPSDSPQREETPDPSTPDFVRTAHVTGWKDGYRIVNPLPMLPGRALIDLGYERCMDITDKAVHAHWHWLQGTPDFAGYEFDSIAPMLGIRESYRLKARYVLSEHDLLAGLSGQQHDDIIAVADHPCDIHGAGGHLSAVTEPYGVPYRCLIPEGDWDNLLVACRGSGFSKIAASSCRLQRTMMQLGQAAGAAAALAVAGDLAVDEIDIDALVKQLDARGRLVPSQP